MDYDSNPHSWTFGFKHPLYFSIDTSLLNNLSNNTPHLRIPKWYLTLTFFLSKIYKEMISQNPSTKTLSSNDTRKLRLNGALIIYKFENNCALKTLFQGSNIFKKDLGRLISWNKEDWNIFIEQKSQTSCWGFDRSI